MVWWAKDVTHLRFELINRGFLIKHSAAKTNRVSLPVQINDLKKLFSISLTLHSENTYRPGQYQMYYVLSLHCEIEEKNIPCFSKKALNTANNRWGLY